MNKFYSPLRYPGGKNKLAPFIAKICIDNKIKGHYVEPYAGGASVALFLLFEGFVDKITINDKDRSIYAFWYCVLNKTNELCNRIEETEINLENWNIQKEVQRNKKTADIIDLGFSTLFLNRTNRSGIINAGVIGGNLQEGIYKIGCRFNKEEIIRRIRLISSRKKQIKLYRKDAIKLIDKIEKESEIKDTIFYFDPPYFLKGSSLYLNHYQESNHKEVSERIKRIRKFKWVVSYDNEEFIKNLYTEYPSKEYSFKHTAYKAKLGQEILFFSRDIILPIPFDWNPVDLKFKNKTQ